LCSRTTDLPLFTIPAGQLTSHKRIPQETEKKEGDDKHEDRPGKFLDQEKYACEHGNDEHQEIRDYVFPRYLYPAELLQSALREKQGAQITFPKRTGFSVIIAVHAMAAQQPELKEKDEQYIPENPDETEPVQDNYANTVDQE
jgi:hypothetical protein